MFPRRIKRGFFKPSNDNRGWRIENEGLRIED
jgi:hypothetical protein